MEEVEISTVKREVALLGKAECPLRTESMEWAASIIVQELPFKHLMMVEFLQVKFLLEKLHRK